MINSIDLKLTAVSTDIKRLGADALVLGVVKGTDGPVLVASPFSAKVTDTLQASLSALNVTGAADELVRLPAGDETKARILVLAGLGSHEESTLTTEALRRGAGSAARQLAGLSTVVFALPAATPEQAAAVAEGVALGAYHFNSHRSTPAAKLPLTEAVIATAASADPDLPAALKRAAILGRAVRATRDLVNVAPNVLYPASFAQEVKDSTKGLPLKVMILDEKKLEKDGYGGLMGVGGGSDRKPRMVKIQYAPAKAGKHLALVGKGITFDTGGISIKPAAGMHAMKCDMAGAATIFQAIVAIAELGLPITVTGWLCLAENMPGGASTRPGDVITMLGGKTVEVLNTDAEGRLVMADGLVAASAEKPDALIDVATLTGAQMVALGLRTAGVMGDEALRNAVVSAAEKAGETAWAMPMPEELRPTIDSQVADLANIGERMGGMMTAAVFLNEFVGEANGTKIPWAHMDIAGPAFNEQAAYGYTHKNGTGSSVRTLVALAEEMASAK
ncbi:leucyl aminopeptidase [Paeniglutamicibacter sp. ZC-3]|uniref:leucyl aminopeptidase n=1 Tax=Paeniglutamicibacter sp. ZC-3 TaxID=2986919 RepID=UPI0021F6BED1|nr:leucyl aminopeptidase [Paeniglutamicibacter sp. ZC-3]MCV9995339.1 leucyl aminopeptidase [Paeniglutamicibacter sp. ZC-3]